MVETASCLTNPTFFLCGLHRLGQMPGSQAKGPSWVGRAEG
jgi:hypothetical protein